MSNYINFVYFFYRFEIFLYRYLLLPRTTQTSTLFDKGVNNITYKYIRISKMQLMDLSGLISKIGKVLRGNKVTDAVNERKRIKKKVRSKCHTNSFDYCRGHTKSKADYRSCMSMIYPQCLENLKSGPLFQPSLLYV